jgi:alanine dehydrogenase
MKTIAILREGKTPPDLRTPLTPQQCVELMQKFPGVKVIAQQSPHRCYTDAQYTAMGVEVKEDVSDADILLGVKEVPIENLVANKTYLFFSHTIKKQPHNKSTKICGVTINAYFNIIIWKIPRKSFYNLILHINSLVFYLHNLC